MVYLLVQSVLRNVYYDESGCSDGETLEDEVEEEVQARSQVDGVSDNNNIDDDEEEEMAWLCPPKTNRLLLFDGSLMHGVVPHLRKDMKAAESKSPRVTLMIGWWGAHVTTTETPTIRQSSLRNQATLANLKPNMTMPSNLSNSPLTGPQGRKKKRPAPDTSLRWPELFEVDSKISEIIETKLAVNQNTLTEVQPSCELIKVAGDLWEEVGECNPTDSLEVIECDVDFLGNWFVRSRSEILDAVERTCMECRQREESITITTEAIDAAVEWISAEELSRLRGD